MTCVILLELGYFYDKIIKFPGFLKKPFPESFEPFCELVGLVNIFLWLLLLNLFGMEALKEHFK